MTGNIWNYNNRIVLINGDCLEWLPKITQQAALVVADPPFYKITNEDWDQAWITPEEYVRWLLARMLRVKDTMAPTASLYLFQMIGHKSTVLLDIAIRLRELFTFQDWITWQKSRGLGNRRGWLYTREECLWFSKSAKYIWNELAQYDPEKPTNRTDLGFNGQPRKSEFKRYTNIWSNNEDQNYGADRIRGHYTPKPLKLIERIVDAHTLTAHDLVIDPFFGTGTTAVACVNLTRRFVGIEKDPVSFELAVDRVKLALEQKNA